VWVLQGLRCLLLPLGPLDRLDPIAIQDPEGQRLAGADPEPERLATAHVITGAGEILSGAEGAPALLRQLPAGYPLAALVAITMPLAKLFYRLLTAARPAIGSIPSRNLVQLGRLA